MYEVTEESTWKVFKVTDLKTADFPHWICKKNASKNFNHREKRLEVTEHNVHLIEQFSVENRKRFRVCFGFPLLRSVIGW